MNTVILIVCIVATILCFFYVKYQRKIKEQGNLLKMNSISAIEEHNRLFNFNKFSSEDDVKNYKSRWNELYIKSNTFLLKQKNMFSLKADILTHITTFISLYKSIEQTKEQCNTIYTTDKEVQNQFPTAYEELKKIYLTDHYISYSECKQFMEKWDDLEKKILIIKTKGTHYSKEMHEKIEELLSFRKDPWKLRDISNKQFVENQLITNKTFFDTVNAFPLDPQQRESIVKLEDNCLVVSSAGSGKTSTMMGKIKYLIQQRKIAPERILTITYTRKAAQELSERLGNSNLKCLTFHALALNIISQTTGKKPCIADVNLFTAIFNTLIKDKEFSSSILQYITDFQSSTKLEFEYESAEDYYADRKKNGILSLFPDASGIPAVTKSEEEKRICTYLTKLGVRYYYERKYDYETATLDKRQYKPDFTIVELDSEGNEHVVLYYEHFGIDKHGNVPKWFKDSSTGKWEEANRKYKNGILWKMETHKEHNTNLMFTTSAEFRDGNNFYEILKQRLIENGVSVKEIPNIQLFQYLVQRDKSLEKSVMNMCQAFVLLLKANGKNLSILIQQAKEKGDNRDIFILEKIMKPIYDAYQNELKRRDEIDFTDAITKATELCNKGMWKKYDYILVDEFQDISIDRYMFLKALRAGNPIAKLYCVGDDWQSIYRFSGSDMSLFSQFSDYFGYTEECKIETTYRFGNPLIQESSSFIEKNPIQKKKNVKPRMVLDPTTNTKKPVIYTDLSFIPYNYTTRNESNRDIVIELPNVIDYYLKKIKPENSVYILGRYTYDIKIFDDKQIIYDINEDKTYVMVGNRKIQYLTVHSSKGLEADYVFLINCNSGIYGFPSMISDDPILDIVLSKSDDYPYGEERRLFYVGITRAKMHTFVLYNEKTPSIFVAEMTNTRPQGSEPCPICKTGYRKLLKKGEAKNGRIYKVWGCSDSNVSRCPYFETTFENNETFKKIGY